MTNFLTAIEEKGINFLCGSYSALDQFFHIKYNDSLYLNTDATLIKLARVFEKLEYPGFPFADASIKINGINILFRCVDKLEIPPPSPFTALSLLYNSIKNIFLDPVDIYKDIRSNELVKVNHIFPPTLVLMEAAKLVSRYHYNINGNNLSQSNSHFIPSIRMQKYLLTSILNSRYPWKGLSLLHKYGFISKYWPDIYRMNNVQQSKDYHPEGDVWNHTLETLKYRKTTDLVLSLALLLHDIGKPVAKRTSNKPFNEHSELGTNIARRFLSKLGFSRPVCNSVTFLVRYHMLPHALKKIPLYRTEKIMDSPLFPQLLELYRADVSATYKGPEGYYDACRVYRKYIKTTKRKIS